MTDLIERYVHEVGRHVPQKERAEIQAELRSMIHDQLEDRFGGAATADDVNAVLVELGHPRRMAASYAGERYLVGPLLYPTMIMVLRRGLAFVPVIVIIVHLVLALFAGEGRTLIEMTLNAAANIFQAMAIFTGVVVLIFALMERYGEDLDEITGLDKAFNPADLPAVDDPDGIDRYEAIFGIAAGVFAIIILLYFLRVGGLTIWFNLSGPQEVIPVPAVWIILLILNTVGLTLMNVLALRRNRWTLGMLVAEMALEGFGAVAFYFAVMRPLFDYGLSRLPGLADIPFIERGPEAFAMVSLLIVLVSGGGKIIKRLMRNSDGGPAHNAKAGA